MASLHLSHGRANEAIYAAVPGLDAAGWVGKIRSIDTNGEGKAVLEVDLGRDVEVSTWNNAFSDIMDEKLIPMDSAMYSTLIDMEEGDRIKFSGSLISDDESYVRESSLTFHGQMNTPNLVFRFSEVAPL